MRVLLLLLPAMLGAQQTDPSPYEPSPEERTAIVGKLTELGKRISLLRAGKSDPLLADVEIYHKAAAWILRFPEEFFNKNYAANTLFVLDRGLARARQLETGNVAWDKRHGRFIRAYRSRVDDSLQPYAVVIPEGLDLGRPQRLDVVLHGRGATLNEVSFIHMHENPKSPPAYSDRIELHVFGRTNNAYRWSGETDVFEALESVRSHYRIDDARVVLRGFSMGGAGAWHIGLHYPHLWAAVEAGAGFTDTKVYARVGEIPAYQEKPLRIYDAVDYSANAFNVPIVGYGGELDRQLQASVNIKERLEQEGLTGLRALFLVGPKTEHRWHTDSKKESDAFIDSQLRRAPRNEVRFLTYTTRYNRCDWLTIDALDQHYERAEVQASRTPDGFRISTRNVARLSLAGAAKVEIDGQALGAPASAFEKSEGKWSPAKFPKGLRKRHGLQGPIDDAFMDRFLCVRPSGKHAATKRLDRFEAEFAKWLRGDIRITDDGSVTPQQIRDHHLVLFGDPQTNVLIKRIAGKLPIRWEKGAIHAGGRGFDASTHTLVMIYPNPLNPERYVVLNTGHTFGEKEFRGTNALLYPRLGDWAVLDAKGETVVAGLFDDRWQLP
jgi:dienelactone hydrolase